MLRAVHRLQALHIGAVLPLARVPARAGSSAWGLSAMEGELECAIRPLGTDRLAAPVTWAVRGRVSAGG